jgi:hypothetical protein
MNRYCRQWNNTQRISCSLAADDTVPAFVNTSDFKQDEIIIAHIMCIFKFCEMLHILHILKHSKANVTSVADSKTYGSACMHR